MAKLPRHMACFAAITTHPIPFHPAKPGQTRPNGTSSKRTRLQNR